MYKKYFSIGLFIVITAFLISCENKKSDKSETGKPAGKTYPDTPEGKYEQLQDKYASGWNTWNYRSVTSHVQMPEAFAVNIGFKDYLSKDILQETMLGFDRENLLMGPHAYDGSYTMTELYEWSDVGYRDPMNIRIQSAHVNDDMVILIEPIGEIDRLKKPLVIVQCGMLWNHPGHIEKNDSVIMATIGDKTISVYSTGDLRPEHYVGGTLSPYLAVQFDGPVGISTGSYRSLTEITSIINSEKKNWEDKKIGFGELAEMFDAIQTVIAWNVVYEPNYERVISPVSRRWSFWNRGYVQYCWDTYFAGLQAAATGSKEVAYCNLVEMTKAKEKAGTPFVPNVEQANGFISRDRSQPPVGSMCLNETYKIFREKWILELLYDDLREWNNWWAENRDYNGLLCYGSTPYDPVVGAGGETEDNNTINGWFGASMESGWDGAELYQEVPFDKQKHILKHWDAALNGLYVMDCRALADIAETLGKKEDAKMLRQRANTYQENIQRLWNEEAGFFYNKNWETGEFSDVTNINGFYPLIAKGATDEQAKAIIENYFYNEKHFWGQWIMPTLSKSHPKFKDQRYWDGRIWPPVNYLVYLGLKNYEHVPIVKKAKNDLVRKSKELLLKDWKARRYVRENYDPRTGIGDESKASARFYHWGGLLGLMPIMEQGGLE
jgi:putative isomerase